LEAVDVALAWPVKKARLCEPGFLLLLGLYIGRLWSFLALLNKGRVSDFQRF
jgi:hypothetical protein